MGPQSNTIDEIVARIAAHGHGVVCRRELLAAGVSAYEIRGRVRRGTLWREYPGVYRVGHRAPSTEATYMAAVKAGGDGAALSGRAAGWLLRLVKGPPPPPEVTTTNPRSIKGLTTRCCRSLRATDVAKCRGIPATTVPRTLIDLAATLTEEDLARACHEANVLYRLTPANVHPRANAPGAAKLRRVLEGDVAVTLSELERGFMRLLEHAGLPRPETNRRMDGKYVDCRWPEHGLTVELDSYRFHNSRHAWREDHRRERDARARGDEHRRYIWEDVFNEPTHTVAELRGLLAA